MASNYYRDLYYQQTENNQILSKEYMRLKVKYDTTYKDLEKENKQLEQDLYIALNKIDKVKEYCERERGNIIKYFEYLDTKDLDNILEILGDKE